MRQITDEDIYRYYLGDVIVGALYNSPLPDRQDDTPSFQLYVHRNTGKICWIDYGYDSQYGNSAINLVQHLRGLPLTGKGYFDAKALVEREVQLGMIGKPLTQLKRKSFKDITPYIRTKERFSDFELDYWSRFDITEDELLREDIRALDSMNWAGKSGSNDLRSTPTDPIFVYWWNRNPSSWKMYRPLAPKRDRFRQENVDGVIEGWNSMIKEYKEVDQFDIMFITSSTKDRLVLKHALRHGLTEKCSVINPRGERDRQDIIAQIDMIKQMSREQYIIYDDDPNGEGWRCAQTLAAETGFEAIDISGAFDGQKDIADYIDKQRGNHSYDELVNIIKQLIK